MVGANKEGVAQFGGRLLKNRKVFVIEIGEDGFNAYAITSLMGDKVLFAASSSMSTFLKVMGDMVRLGSGKDVEFQVVVKGGEN
jgi:hypothetical protein